MAIPRQFLGMLVLLSAGCVSSSPLSHGVSDKMRDMSLAATPQPVSEGQITPQNAQAQAQALAEELDRDEKECMNQPKECTACKH